MKPELLCMGCMARKGNAVVCAQCGYFDQPPENPQQLPPRTILEGKYVIGRALGQGGFGITYLGCDLELNKKLAIKEYFPVQISTRAQDHLTVSPISIKNQHDMEYGLGKFADEAKALSHFKDHPGVVSMLDFLYANDTAYIVMAYVDGRDLKEYLNQHGGKISFEAALKILYLVMAALEDVHRAGIVHRDISPDNIYVETNGAVKILDFGATRYAMGEQSRSLSIVLKPGYAPEEQYRGKGRQGAWTDIYALGATFYRSITGRVPPDALDRLIEDELVPPSGLGIAIPANSEAALMKALAVKAGDRFQSVAAFRQAMMPQRVTPQALAPQPVSQVAGPLPVPAQPVVRMSEPVEREPPAPSTHLPKIFLLTAISILLLILFIATSSQGTIWGWQLMAVVILFGVMMFLFGRMWKSIQDGHARTTPDNAVAYCFIPGFNLYWAFPVLWGFAKDYNSFLNRHAREGVRLNESVFLISSMAYVAGWVVIPFFGFLASLLILLNACFLLPVVAMICDAVNGLETRPVNQIITPEKLFSLFGISGEYQGQTLGVDGQGIVIGRNPSRANVVLASDEISGRHVYVWQDAANAGVWIEDMKSTNGTFYRQMRSGGGIEWVQVVGRKLLFAGDRFRLSRDGAEFEVKSA
jgi:serine/threonine protein kinase